jgi:hypothetical protein
MSSGVSQSCCLGVAGVTFDTGGYNIKAGAGSMIEMMKFDSADPLAYFHSIDFNWSQLISLSKT